MPPLENLRIEAPLREGGRGASDHAAAERAPTPSDNVRMRDSAAQAASGAVQPTNREYDRDFPTNPDSSWTLWPPFIGNGSIRALMMR